MTAFYAAAYLAIGVSIVAAWHYFAPWTSPHELDRVLGSILSTLGWPAALCTLLYIVAAKRGAQRQVRLAVERKRREKETQEIDRIIAEQKL